jgi:type II secretory pathway pseudopilin PulG
MTNILNFPYRVNKFRVKNSQIGFSVLEVVLAASLFTIFATGIAIAVISGQDNNRLSRATHRQHLCHGRSGSGEVNQKSGLHKFDQFLRIGTWHNSQQPLVI